MNFPSQLQAHVFWLHASGMSARQIGEALGCSPQAAQNALDAARRKAQKIGLTYRIQKPEISENESGMKDRHLLFAPQHDFFSLDAGALISSAWTRER